MSFAGYQGGGDADARRRHIRGLLAEATRRHGRAIAGAVDPTGITLPRVATYLAARSAKSVVFTSQRSVGCLRQAFFLLLADGQWERVEFIADRLATVRKHESGPFEPIRDMINGARWYAVRAGLRSVIERLTPAAFDPPGYKPLFLSGESLMRPLDDPATRANVGLDTNEPFDILPVSERPGPFLMDLSKMSTMWAYGGSAEWPVERLEAERVRLEAAMKELPGMH